MLATITRTLATFAALAAALLVALAVTTLRALDARGVTLAGALLDAMGAARAVRPPSAHPYRNAAPANRRRASVVTLGRSGELDTEAVPAEVVTEGPSARECSSCDGTGEGWGGRRCGGCRGRGEVSVPSALDFDRWSFTAAAA